MNVFLFLLMAGVLAWFWRRIDHLEWRVAQFEEAQGVYLYPETRAAPAEAGPQAEVESDIPDEPAADIGREQDLPKAAQPLLRGTPQPATEPPLEESNREPDPPAEPTYETPEHFDAAEEPQPETSRRFSFAFEDLFGRLLPIWAGGITLAVAGFFLIRYSIENGWITESVRVALGFLFGLGLLGVAEAAYRQAARISDPRVAQALAGAGLATLYGSFYMAGELYGLIGSGLAFVGLAGVTAAAIALSFRFGLPSAILGLVGGFAAPLLISSENPNLPLLTAYLGLVTAGLVMTGERQKRAWLGIIALFIGIGWGALMLLTGGGSIAELLALGSYFIVLGAILPSVAGRTLDATPIRLIASAFAAWEMAWLVNSAGHTPLAWSLYLLLAGALAFFGWQQPKMREASAIAGATAVFLALFWNDPSAYGYPPVAAALAAIFAGVPLAQIWRGEARRLDIAMLCGIPLALIGVSYFHYGLFTQSGMEWGLALSALALGTFPALASWKLWASEEGPLAPRCNASLASAAVMAFIAGLLATPIWAAPLVAATVTAGLAALLMRHRGETASVMLWISAMVTLVALLANPPIIDEMSQLIGLGDDGIAWQAILRWAAALGGFLALMTIDRSTIGTRIAEALAALVAYGLLAQILPSQWLAWTTALAVLALAWRWPERTGAQAAWLGVLVLWASAPLLAWLDGAVMALTGEPMLVRDVATPVAAARYLAPLVAALGAIWFAAAKRARNWAGIPATLFAFTAMVLVHTFYKQVFGLIGPNAFNTLGMIERTVWEGLLIGLGLLLAQAPFGKEWLRRLAPLPIALGLAHFAIFTLLWHNPLWTAQAVGPLPIANWLLFAYALAAAAIIWLRGKVVDEFAPLRPVADTAIMALVSLWALSSLRHIFSGTILIVEPMTQGEDLLRSLLGIVLAIGFLLWGARTGERTWRIGSLVFILLAVLKVFLFDASGLEGLARIASFMALGFSLIGIGWFYSKQLRKPEALPASGN